jgi:hypothetical protein
MGVATSEVGYTPAMPRREDHEVHKGHVMALEKKKSNSLYKTHLHKNISTFTAPFASTCGRPFQNQAG